MTQRIRIRNGATYSPVSLLDVALAAPLVSRIVFRNTLPGKAIQLAALGAYIGSAAHDWIGRRGVRRIDFLAHYGADVTHLLEMTEAERWDDVRRLVADANDRYTSARLPRAETARLVDRLLTDYIAGITGQRVETSTEVRDFTFAALLFPFALGACDFLSGDIAIFKDTGVFEPHVIAHEFAHRKGYWKELEAQALAYLVLSGSGDPILEQSARCERIHRQLRALCDEAPDRYPVLVRAAGLRPELEAGFLAMHVVPGPLAVRVSSVMKALYEERMKLTGQNGIRDYDVGFTNFLHTVERNGRARYLAGG